MNDMTKADLLEENDVLIELLEDINAAVELPDDLQERLEEFLCPEEEDEDREDEDA